MKESIIETITEDKEVGIIHTCNKCGKSATVKSIQESWSNDIKSFSVDFGYGSQFDGEEWSFDLCEGCMLDMIKQFKYAPSKSILF